MLYTVTTESTYYGIVDYIKAEYVMGDYSLYKALEREFVADSERCEHELAVVLAEARRQFVDGQNVVHQPCRV